MKSSYLLLLFCLCTVCLYADNDSTAAIQRLSKRVENLEAILNWVKLIGIPLISLTSLWAAYMWFFGIKKKVDALIDEDANKKIEEKTAQIVERKLKEYPFIQEYEQILKIKKEKSIVIVGPTSREVGLIESLEKMGFKSPASFSIAEALELKKIEAHLLLFDNRSESLKQSQMDEIVQQLKGQIRFGYFSSEGGPRWESTVKDHGKMAFANSMGRLEQNIIDLFK
jgi:hypothetical protein